MNSLVLAEITWQIWLMAIGFMFVSGLMMLVILIQKPKGGGLSGAFGGGAGGGSEGAVIGAGIGDVLTIITVTCFIGFLLLAMGLTWGINPTTEAEKPTEAEQVGGQAPTTTPAEIPTDPTPTPGPELETGEEEPVEETGSAAEELVPSPPLPDGEVPEPGTADPPPAGE